MQLLLLLGALLVLGFVPLFYATSTYTRIALEQQQREAAAHLGRSIAARLAVDRRRMDASALLLEASSQVGSGAVHAVAVYDREGAAIVRAGQPDLVERLTVGGPRSRLETLATSRGAALRVYIKDVDGAVATISRIDPVTTRAAALTRITALYMALGAVALLAFAYLGLTRWIVRPVLTLGSAALRVAEGARRLEPLTHAAPELRQLGQSLTAMTERLRGDEVELRRKIEQLEATTEDLRTAQVSLVRSEKLATVGRLAAGLAHEVGNPLSALMGFCDLLLDDELPPEQRRDFIERMRKETGRIDRVLSDLLAYGRTEGSPGVNAPPHLAGSVEEAVSDVLALLSPQKDLKDVRVEAKLAKGLPGVRLGQAALVQVLLNLVMNAVDACERRGTVRIAAMREAGDVQLEVEDTGPGIAAQVADSLFEPFVTTKEVGKGTGLGLSVSRGLVEAAGGTIVLDSDYAAGARFVLRLPVQEAPGAERASPS